MTPTSETFPLSFAQQRLWFFDQWKPESPMYIIPIRWQLYGALNVAALTRALNEIVRRHEILRTTFTVQNDEPVQAIAPTLTLEIPHLDWRSMPADEQSQKLRELSIASAVRPFDLTQLPLIRAQLVWLADEEHQLLVDAHHIVFDGWSAKILREELLELYVAFNAGQPAALPELSIQYVDFTLWEREQMQEETLRPHLDYWKAHFTPLPSPLTLPTDRPRPAAQNFRGAVIRMPFDPALTPMMDKFSQAERSTPFITLLAALAVFLARYSGQTDIVIGTPIAGRTQPEVETLIGFFVNTLALRLDLSKNPSFRELVAQARRVALESYEHQDMPFEKLVEALAVKHDLSQNPLFQIMLTLFDDPVDFSVPGLHLRMLPTETTETAKFDFAVNISAVTYHAVTFEYNTEIFEADTIYRMGYNFQALLANLLQHPDRPVLNQPILAAAEQQQLLDWSHGARDYQTPQSVQEQFAARVQEQPDQPATVYKDEQLTYAELHRRTQSLAALLTHLTEN